MWSYFLSKLCKVSVQVLLLLAAPPHMTTIRRARTQPVDWRGTADPQTYARIPRECTTNSNNNNNNTTTTLTWTMTFALLGIPCILPESKNSTMCRNVNHFLYDLNIDNLNLQMYSVNHMKELYCKKWLSSVNKNYIIQANCIKDLCKMKEGVLPPNLNVQECDFLIRFLCTL